jgi:enoyl-[acyl-carrier protein] reductase II
VIEGSEAGGHIGPVSTSVLAQEFLPALAQITSSSWLAALAGARRRRLSGNGRGGRAARHALCLRHRSIAHPAFKQAFFRGNARDAVASVQVDPRLPVIPVRALKNKGTEEFTAKQIEVAHRLDAGEVDMHAAQLEIEHFWAGALRRAVIDGDVEHGSIMAGQSVGMVTKRRAGGHDHGPASGRVRGRARPSLSLSRACPAAWHRAGDRR